MGKVDAAIISVNGKVIDQNALEYNVKANIERGLQDSQNLRDIIKDEMITKDKEDYIETQHYIGPRKIKKRPIETLVSKKVTPSTNAKKELFEGF